MIRIYLIILSACLFSLWGCSSQPKRMDVLVTAAGDINPDLNGRPSPVVFKLYQLKSLKAFQRADYDTLRGAHAPFDADVVSVDEHFLSPYDVLRLSMEAKPEARYLAVFASYRDRDAANWRRANGIRNVRALELPVVGWSYRQELPVRIKLSHNLLSISSPMIGYSLAVAEKYAQVKKAVHEQEVLAEAREKKRNESCELVRKLPPDDLTKQDEADMTVEDEPWDGGDEVACEPTATALPEGGVDALSKGGLSPAGAL